MTGIDEAHRDQILAQARIDTGSDDAEDLLHRLVDYLVETERRSAAILMADRAFRRPHLRRDVMKKAGIDDLGLV